jgi:hypothetical protein
MTIIALEKGLDKQNYFWTNFGQEKFNFFPNFFNFFLKILMFKSMLKTMLRALEQKLSQEKQFLNNFVWKRAPSRGKQNTLLYSTNFGSTK